MAYWLYETRKSVLRIENRMNICIKDVAISTNAKNIYQNKNHMFLVDYRIELLKVLRTAPYFILLQ